MVELDSLRRSWNQATRNHNSHKGDQAAFFRAGGDVLFPEELELLGPLEGKRLVHLQCNAGQDSLCLARRGADVLGVDLSDEAIAFARGLSDAARIPARFENAEVVGWMERTEERFDLAFSSYGACGWLPDLQAWARGIRRVLAPGGHFVYVEFHPAIWSFGAGLTLTGDDYFHPGPFLSPVFDYVAKAGAALGGVDAAPPQPNEIPAPSWQHGVAEIVQSLLDAGLQLETLREWPHANGARLLDELVAAEGRRWVWPEGTARLPLMFGLVARAP